MSNKGQILKSQYVLWFLLAVPWVVMTARYVTGDIYYGEFIHQTGDFSVKLLMVTMAITPFRLMFPRYRWTNWVMQRRRYFGVAVFAYAVPHLAAYLVNLGTFGEILGDSLEPGIWTAWLAMVLFAILALTSNNASVRKLGARWKSLHKLVYFAAVFTFLHWILVAYDPIPGAIHAGILLLLESYRIWKSRRIVFS